MNRRKKRPLLGNGFNSLLASLFAILVGLLFGLMILIISNPPQAIAGFGTVLLGGFNTFLLGSSSLKGLGDVLYTAAPIILTGLSVGFAFKTGLFNIGASGQFIVGALVSVWIGVKATGLPPQIHWLVALLGGMLAGGIWALVPGMLKAYRNVNEVIACIMMNYIGMFMVNDLVKTYLYDSRKNQSLTPPASAMVPKMGLNEVFAGSTANAGILIALVMIIIVYIILNKTTFGYELKACGYNRDASRYAGINEKRSIVLSMVIAGMLSGLAGGIVYLAGKHIEVVDVLAAEGFNGIPVALLGLSNPFGIFLSGIFIAHITIGGFYLQRYNFYPQVIEIIIACIIYFSAFSLVFKNLITGFADRRRQSRASARQGEGDSQ